MAKRSPILGYNHNVRYRGLVFHVQTEDSGLQNPHLFTHLFHEGVIVSTRKLVYDAGSNEESIKSLMQAQHKAVMKDLRKGTFDEKIDQYLGDTPGLEPRGTAAKGERALTEPSDIIATAQAAMSVSEGSPIEIVNEGLSEPIELPKKDSGPQPTRTTTAERTSPPRHPPPPDDLGTAPTIQGSAAEMAAAIAAANAGSSPRTSTAQRVAVSPRTATPPMVSRTATPFRDSNPVIEISVEDDDHNGRARGPRDTAVETSDFDAIPQRTGADSVPPTLPVQKSRPASHGAATLPAMKPPSRPAITPPLPAQRSRNPEESQPIEIHQAAPPSVEPPPGERSSERPGQYSVNRKDGAPIREQTGRIVATPNPSSIPSGLARPRPGSGPNPPSGRDSSQMRAVPGNVPKEPTPSNRPPTAPQASQPRTATPGARVPQPQQPPGRQHGTAPIANRTPSPSPPANNSGVVMTRPAVIVGAPPKPPAAATTQRVRKAREEEGGRGFGQGLISEKSLDEVILAYLSEDAEEK